MSEPGALLQALTDSALAQHFGAAVLQRARALAGAVRGLQPQAEGARWQAQAELQGSAGRPYAMRLEWSPGADWRGSCSCPHAAQGAACKHQAALALAWRAHLAGETLTSPSDAAPPDAAAEPGWQAFVREQPAEALAARLLAWADREPDLRRELQAWQRSAAPLVDAAAARAAVAAVLSAPRVLHERRVVNAYARRAEAVLGLIEGWTAIQPGLALIGAGHALSTLRRVWERADDSDGVLGALMASLAQTWLHTLRAAGPQGAAFGKAVHAQLVADDHALFDLAALQQAMGAAAAARCAELLQQDWQQAAEHREPWGPRAAAKRRLAAWWQAQGDAEAELALLRSALRESVDHVDLIQALLRWGRSREALQAAEAARRLHPRQPRLEALLLQAYERDGWDAEALALRRQQFERQPSLTAYAACLQAAQRACQDADAERERLWALLATREREPLAQWAAGLRLELWAHEQRWDEALAWLAQPRALPPQALADFAGALPAVHHDQAVPLLQRVLAWQMSSASAPYARELALVRQVLERQPPPAQRLWLAWLRVEYRVKKRFVEGLEGL